MRTYTVYFKQCFEITVEADDQDEAMDIAIGTPLDDWTSTGEDMTVEPA